jgi:hypothetical protein
MTPSNAHPGTAARGLRRAFLLQAACSLFTVLIAAPAPALAQNVIQFTVSASTDSRYEVKDDRTGFRTLPFPQAPGPRINATTRSDYPGGRQFTYPAALGNNNNVFVWSEATGQSKAVTNIQGPLGVVSSGGGMLWSNDGLDSFVSFILYNSTTSFIYRAHVSATAIADPAFQPVTLGDPRLEMVKSDFGRFYWWNHSGSGFYYTDPRDATKIRLKTVGVGVTFDDDPVSFIAPFPVGELRVSPPVGLQDPDRYLVASTLNSGLVGNGILAMDLGTSTSPPSWWWLAGPQPTFTVSGIRGPCFSPDGTHIAFGNTRYAPTHGNQAIPYYGVYTVPFSGGPISGPVAEVMGSSKTRLYTTVNNWYTP